MGEPTTAEHLSRYNVSLSCRERLGGIYRHDIRYAVRYTHVGQQVAGPWFVG